MFPLLAIASAFLMFSSLHAHGAASPQAYPNRPVRILVPLTAGGNMDGITRALAQRLTESFGQQFIVDNRPGAGNMVALELLHGAAPDGHTLMTTSLTAVIHPLLYKSRFDLLNDFAVVSQISSQGYVMVVNNGVPAKSASDLVQHLKANPAKLSCMSTGIGSPIHLTGELFQSVTGTRMLHVPYKGAAYGDIVNGLVQVGFPTVVSVLPFLQNARVRPLAITTPKRASALPDVPTFAEGGVNGVVVMNWYGIIAPKGTPAALVERLSKQIGSAMHSPELRKRLAADSPRPWAARLPSSRRTSVPRRPAGVRSSSRRACARSDYATALARSGSTGTFARKMFDGSSSDLIRLRRRSEPGSHE